MDDRRHDGWIGGLPIRSALGLVDADDDGRHGAGIGHGADLAERNRHAASRRGEPAGGKSIRDEFGGRGGGDGRCHAGRAAAFDPEQLHTDDCQCAIGELFGHRGFDDVTSVAGSCIHECNTESLCRHSVANACGGQRSGRRPV